ncbi:hypothetical protein GQS52_19690 [Streptomyces sp. SCUT-3]|nr:hypothetical protein [Streptomyces sp. SCUT-3]PLW65955.1 hypothetical protein C0036_25330 [Streptomyces sp. DJ]QMV23624.1 hypothetical protein GQS52_19690 [Streptomyces sp. SCUT-3]
MSAMQGDSQENVAAANEAVREFVARRAGRSWSREDLEELDRLRRTYTQAVRAAQGMEPQPV